ncbi:MAG TPA: F0F1 ATP synthase subunit B [Candidatus Limiplasma sp.]|nr:F0F1 ATP synthase subunit B [Candidatus Limiplasma sp.]HPS81621.1 F0F1 ATP synthase subunit B [Candidatus Limiplasma sp.]
MFNPLSILLHVVNAAILLVALYFLLYRPVRRYMNNRSSTVAKELQDVLDAQEKLRVEQDEAQQEVQAAQKQAADVVAKSVAQAQEQAQHILEDAHSDAELTLRQARTETEFMRRNARNEMRDEVANLSVELAERILQREVKQDDHAKLVEDFLKKVE